MQNEATKSLHRMQRHKSLHCMQRHGAPQLPLTSRPLVPVRVLVQVQYRMQTVRAELYVDYKDNVRFGFEIILSAWVYGWMLYNFWQIAMYQKERGNCLKVGWALV